MKTYLIFAAVYIGGIFATVGQSKYYAIQSLEGITQNISLTDVGHETAIVRCGKNEFIIHDFWVLDMVTLEAQKFLKIKYAVRGGSDLSLQNTLLLTVSKGRIKAPFFIFSEEKSSLKAIDSDVDTVLFDEKNLYRAHLSLSGNSIRNYKVVVNITDSSKSKVELKNNYNQHRQLNFKFDKRNGIFCNAYIALNKRFTIIERHYALKSSVKMINGTFPSVVIREPRGRYATNYYINGRWYEKDEKDRLVACY